MGIPRLKFGLKILYYYHLSIFLQFLIANRPLIVVVECPTASQQQTPAEISGEILAFVDMNYDRFTDLIVKQNDGTLLVVYKSITEETDLKFTEKSKFVVDQAYTQDFSQRGRIENVACGDFNADSFPDLLVSTISNRNHASRTVDITICWGGVDRIICEFDQIYSFAQQPLILNCDDDPISDFLAQELDGSIRCYQGQKNLRKFAPVTMSAMKNLTLVNNAAHGFVDITGDLDADLVLQVDGSSLGNVTVHPKLPIYQIWTRSGPGQQWAADPAHQPGVPPLPSMQNDQGQSSVSQPPDLFSLSDQFTVGHVIFDDFNRDGITDLMTPVCQGPKTDRCQKFWLLVWSGGQKAWFWLAVENFHNLALSQASLWKFPDWEPTSGDESVDGSLIVRSGDYTQTGYPDLLAVLGGSKNKTQSQAFFIENTDCTGKEKNSRYFNMAFSAGTFSSSPTNPDRLANCTPFGRTFVLAFTPLTPCPSVKTAAFFDLREDGTLDLMYECRAGQGGQQQQGVADSTTKGPKYNIQFTSWTSDHDTTFLKVQTYTATCGSACLNGKEGTGISLPGAALSYSMADSDGNTVSAAYTQQSRTTHKALLLPYALFGLGRSPNFVQSLNLGIPQFPGAHYEWLQLVPNTRMYVIPFPANEPSHWVGRLYVTPSRLILMSVSALGGVCLLILIMIVILQCYEMRQDRRERDVLKKRFHFDAM